MSLSESAGAMIQINRSPNTELRCAFIAVLLRCAFIATFSARFFMRCRRSIMVSLIILFISPAMAGATYAQETPQSAVQDILEEQLKALDTSELEGFLREVDQSVKQYLPEVSLVEILRRPGLAPRMRPSNVGTGIIAIIFRELRANMHLLGQLVCLAVLCNFLTALVAGIGSEGVTNVARWVSFLVLALIGLNSFRITISIARGAIFSMTSLMYVLLPSMFSLLAAVGGIAQVGVLSPLLLASTNMVANIVSRFAFPAIFTSGLFEVLGMTSDRVHVSQLAGLFRAAAAMVLGLSFAIFLGIATVQEAGASAVDGVAVRSAKFLASTFIPVIGKLFSDAVSVAASCSLLIQNSLKVVGLLSVFAICFEPIVKILAVVVMYRLAAALVEPLGDERIAKSLGALGNSLTMVAVVVGLVALMFFVTIGMLSGFASVTAYSRS
ncbi:MAG TPA: stage III sporulation protein AE [Firmicutes bacterium]|nr:stage III sporulation protein AE [Bacillota bacterium]